MKQILFPTKPATSKDTADAIYQRQIITGLHHIIAAKNKTIELQAIEITKLKRQIHEPKVFDSVFGIEQIVFNAIKRHIYDDFEIWMLSIKLKPNRILFPRQAWISLMCKYSRYSLQRLGAICGNKDHTTIMHSRDAYRDMVETNKLLYLQYNKAQAEIESNIKAK